MSEFKKTVIEAIKYYSEDQEDSAQHYAYGVDGMETEPLVNFKYGQIEENNRLREGIISDLCALVEKMSEALNSAMPSLKEHRILTQKLKMYKTFEAIDDWFIDHEDALKLKDEFLEKLKK